MASTIPVLQPDPSKVIPVRLGATPNRMARVECVRGHSAASVMVARHGASRSVAEPASVAAARAEAEGELEAAAVAAAAAVAVAAGIGNRKSDRVICGYSRLEVEKTPCGERSRSSKWS